MKIKSFLNGLFPRSKEIRKALRSYQKKEITREELEKVYNSEAIKIIQLQKELKISYIYDGLLKWQDLLRPFSYYEGIKEGTLIRWFETNFFYRMPIVKGKISLKNPVLKDFYAYDSIIKLNDSMISFPDPLSFAMLSENHYYSNIEELAKDFSKALIEDLSSFAKNISHFQILSPAIAYFGIDKKEILILKEFIEGLKKINSKVKISIHFSFLKKYDFLKNLPLEDEIISLDLCYGDREKILNYLANFISLSLGLIDTSTSLIESIDYLRNEVERISRKIKGLEEIFITNSADLDLLPFDVALEKIKVLKDFVGHEL